MSKFAFFCQINTYSFAYGLVIISSNLFPNLFYPEIISHNKMLQDTNVLGQNVAILVIAYKIKIKVLYLGNCPPTIHETY
jgi:hypothetical protein